MKKKIIIPLLAAVLMLQSILPVSAAELPVTPEHEENNIIEDEPNISNNYPDLENGIGALASPQEIADFPEDELVGIEATTVRNITFTGVSVSNYAILDAGQYFYFYNRTGRTMYYSNIYVQGYYQFQNRSVSNGSYTSAHNNINQQVVLYYKYDASTNHLLTTWSYLKDWPYLDVFPTVINWEYNAIKYCSDNNLMVGTGANLFDPDVPITRAMFATIVYRMAGSPQVSYRKVFSDVPSGQWYSEGITWASQNGIVEGFGDGTYAPNAVITREQAAAILQRYAKYRGYNATDTASLSKFVDSAAVSAWARENVSWAVARSLISGRPNGSQLSLAPKASATRAECASMIMRFRENIGL